MTDNRTNEPTPEQVEAAAKALREMRNFDEGVSSLLLESWSRMVATTALVAAQGAAPQAESKCQTCSREASFCAHCVAEMELAPALPSSGVDEDKLAEVIARVTDLWDDPLDEVHDIPQIARAVAEWLKGQGR